MMFRGLHLFFLVACGLVLAFDLPAQTPAADRPPPTFRIVSVVGDYGELHYRVSAKEPDRVINSNRALSGSLPMPTGSQLEIYRLIPPPPDSPPGTPPTKQVAIKANLNPSIPESIVVVLPITPEDPGTLFNTLGIVAPPEFRAGTCLIANFTSYPQAAVLLKDKVHTLDAGKTDLFAFTEGHILVRVAVPKGDGWAIASDDAWRLPTDYRGYILIFPYVKDPDSPPLPDRSSGDCAYQF